MSINLAAHSEQRVAIFIDTQNLYHSAKANFRANVNYEELMRVAVLGRRLVRAFAYVIKSAESTEEKFFDALEDIGIEMRMKDLQVFHTGAKKADWDVGIAVDMIRLTEKVDVIVLASGDGDFLEVIRYCQSRGVRVEIMAFEKTTNSKIIEESDHFTDLGDKKYCFLIGGRRKTIGSSGAVTSPVSQTLSVPLTNATIPLSVAKSSFKEDMVSVVPIANTNIFARDGNIPKNGSSISPTESNVVDKYSAGNVHVMEKATHDASANAHVLARPFQISAGSNLSNMNRSSLNSNKTVSPSIYSHDSNVKRKIRPVVGLPGKPPNRVLEKVIKRRRKIQRVQTNSDNAFGNSRFFGSSKGNV